MCGSEERITFKLDLEPELNILLEKQNGLSAGTSTQCLHAIFRKLSNNTFCSHFPTADFKFPGCTLFVFVAVSPDRKFNISLPNFLYVLHTAS